MTTLLQAQEAAAQAGTFDFIDAGAGHIVEFLAGIFFAPVPLPYTDGTAPLVVLWLVLGAIFFTFRMGFINLRGLGHSIKVVSGRYTDPNSHGAGEVTHFQALASALSATVGLGNIAGVAIAVSMGGPGAIFWMVTAGFLGMSSKFVECTLNPMLLF